MQPGDTWALLGTLGYLLGTPRHIPGTLGHLGAPLGNPGVQPGDTRAAPPPPRDPGDTRAPQPQDPGDAVHIPPEVQGLRGHTECPQDGGTLSAVLGWGRWTDPPASGQKPLAELPLRCSGIPGGGFAPPPPPKLWGAWGGCIIP